MKDETPEVVSSHQMGPKIYNFCTTQKQSKVNVKNLITDSRNVAIQKKENVKPSDIFKITHVSRVIKFIMSDNRFPISYPWGVDISYHTVHTKIMDCMDCMDCITSYPKIFG